MSNICETYQWLAIKTFDIIIIPIVNHYNVNCQESKRKNAITGIGKLQGFEHNASQVKYIRSMSLHWKDHRNRRYHNYQWNHLTFMKSLSEVCVFSQQTCGYVVIFATQVHIGCDFQKRVCCWQGGKLLHNGWKICELPSNYFSLTCQQNSFTEFEFCSVYTVQSSIIGCITHILIGNECFNPKYRDLTFWRRHMKYAVF